MLVKMIGVSLLMSAAESYVFDRALQKANAQCSSKQKTKRDCLGYRSFRLWKTAQRGCPISSKWHLATEALADPEANANYSHRSYSSPSDYRMWKSCFKIFSVLNSFSNCLIRLIPYYHIRASGFKLFQAWWVVSILIITSNVRWTE